MTTYIQFVKGIHGHKSVWLETRDKEGKERIDSQRIVGNKPWAGGVTQEELPVDLERFLNNIQCYIKANPSLVSHPTLFEKAAAYDRLMSGGKKTLKEIANFLQHPIAIQPSRSGCIAIFANVPFLGETEWKGHWMSTIACDFDYSGDWKDSLTMPDGWEEK